LSLGKRNLQKALVFQGGEALGAYEAGTYQQIYKKVSQESADDRLFDIIAGTSIGAINSTVLVGHYLKNKNSWVGSAEKLLEFWEGFMCPTIADNLLGGNQFVRNSWNYLRTINRGIADVESARRFWSIFEFAFSPRVYQTCTNLFHNGVPSSSTRLQISCHGGDMTMID
jgi:predicted acylesterase/phospholipase RssA